MQLADIQLMYEYNRWANHLIMAKAAEVTPEQLFAPTTHSWGSLHGTLVHLLDTEWAWRDTLQMGNWNTIEIKPEDVPTLAAVKARWDEEEAAWRDYLGGLTDADMPRLIRYAIPDGGYRERVLWHCLYHVVNHGMQHRAEAAHMLTQYEQSPGGLDFTRFLNER